MEMNEIRDLVDRWVDAWNSVDEAGVMAIYDDNAVLYQAPMKKTLTGKEHIQARFRDFAEMSEDATFTVRNLLVHENTAVLEFNITGTQTGKFLDYEPTNRKMDVDSCIILEFKDDKVVKHTTYLDTATILRSLGLITVEGARAEAA